jgi:SAM-dependent methyltransferase
LNTVALSAVCAGCGDWTGFGFHADGSALAREVGPKGRVFSTELDPGRLRRLHEAVLAARLDNVTVVEASVSQTGLPPNCCDAIVLRRVYHHLAEPSAINASLLRSLRPGGVLAVIDFPPPFFFSRGRLGVPAQDVIAEVTGRGFEVLRLIDDWPGRGPLGSYCVVFRKPP